MPEIEIQESIVNALRKMSLVQQYKLLDFINAMQLTSSSNQFRGILKFAGIFDSNDTREFEQALLDSSQIDHNEW